jgi:hypothetical protein
MAAPQGRPQSLTNRPVAKFLTSLYSMVDESVSPAISWSEDGRRIVIADVSLLESEVLGKYFKTSKFSSLSRQVSVTMGGPRLSSPRVAPRRSAGGHRRALRSSTSIRAFHAATRCSRCASGYVMRFCRFSRSTDPARPDVVLFEHPNFFRGGYDELGKVVRRTNKSGQRALKAEGFKGRTGVAEGQDQPEDGEAQAEERPRLNIPVMVSSAGFQPPTHGMPWSASSTPIAGMYSPETTSWRMQTSRDPHVLADTHLPRSSELMGYELPGQDLAVRSSGRNSPFETGSLGALSAAVELAQSSSSPSGRAAEAPPPLADPPPRTSVAVSSAPSILPRDVVFAAEALHGASMRPVMYRMVATDAMPPPHHMHHIQPSVSGYPAPVMYVQYPPRMAQQYSGAIPASGEQVRHVRMPQTSGYEQGPYMRAPNMHRGIVAVSIPQGNRMQTYVIPGGGSMLSPEHLLKPPGIAEHPLMSSDGTVPPHLRQTPVLSDDPSSMTNSSLRLTETLSVGGDSMLLGAHPNPAPRRPPIDRSVTVSPSLSSALAEPALQPFGVLPPSFSIANAPPPPSTAQAKTAVMSTSGPSVHGQPVYLQMGSFPQSQFLPPYSQPHFPPMGSASAADAFVEQSFPGVSLPQSAGLNPPMQGDSSGRVQSLNSSHSSIPLVSRGMSNDVDVSQVAITRVVPQATIVFESQASDRARLVPISRGSSRSSDVGERKRPREDGLKVTASSEESSSKRANIEASGQDDSPSGLTSASQHEMGDTPKSADDAPVSSVRLLPNPSDAPINSTLVAAGEPVSAAVAGELRGKAPSMGFESTLAANLVPGPSPAVAAAVAMGASVIESVSTATMPIAVQTPQGGMAVVDVPVKIHTTKFFADADKESTIEAVASAAANAMRETGAVFVQTSSTTAGSSDNSGLNDHADVHYGTTSAGASVMMHSRGSMMATFSAASPTSVVMDPTRLDVSKPMHPSVSVPVTTVTPRDVGDALVRWVSYNNPPHSIEASMPPSSHMRQYHMSHPSEAMVMPGASFQSMAPPTLAPVTTVPSQPAIPIFPSTTFAQPQTRAGRAVRMPGAPTTAPSMPSTSSSTSRGLGEDELAFWKHTALELAKRLANEGGEASRAQSLDVLQHAAPASRPAENQVAINRLELESQVSRFEFASLGSLPSTFDGGLLDRDHHPTAP